MEREINEFNSAFLFVENLEKTFYSCSIALAQLDLNSSYHLLGCLIRLLSGEMKPEEQKAFNNRWFNLSQDINNFLNNQKRGRGFINSSLVQELHELEQDLRKIYRASGLQNKIQDTASKALR